MKLVDGDRREQPKGAAWVVNAKYIEQDVPEYCGNPLIEALPPVLTAEQATARLEHYPSYDEGLRDAPDHIRHHLIQTGTKFFLPLDVHIDLQRRFSNLIRVGYVSRNPFTSGHWRAARARQQCFDQYDDQPDYSPGGFESLAAGFHLVGISGVGKTSAVLRTLKLYPQIIRHSAYNERDFTQQQLVWLKLDCPFDGNLRGLCLEFFKSVDDVLGTGYERNYSKGRRLQEELRAKMATVASNHMLGVLVIDEIQRLSLVKSGGAERMLNFFTQLVNTIGVPVVLVGTYKALTVLTGDFSQMRRGTGQGDLIWDRMGCDDQWELFAESLWRFQYTRRVCPFESDPAAVQALYDESQGITDLAVKLYMFAQELAIESRQERVTAAIIRSAARHKFGMLRRVIQALKSGEPRALEAYEDVYPTALRDYLRQLPAGGSVHVAGAVTASPVIKLAAQAAAPESENVEPAVRVAAETKTVQRRVRKLRAAEMVGAKDALPLVSCLSGAGSSKETYDRLARAGWMRPSSEFLGDEVRDAATVMSPSM